MAIALLIGFLVGTCFGMWTTDSYWKDRLTIRGYGRYHPMTKQFQWKNPDGSYETYS